MFTQKYMHVTAVKIIIYLKTYYIFIVPKLYSVLYIICDNDYYPTGGKLCSFSPCIEQVQRTCAKLIGGGYIELNTYECLQKEMNVQYKSLPILDFECLKYKVCAFYYLLNNIIIMF